MRGPVLNYCKLILFKCIYMYCYTATISHCCSVVTRLQRRLDCQRETWSQLAKALAKKRQVIECGKVGQKGIGYTRN